MNKKIKITDYTRKGKKTTYTYLYLTKWQIFIRKVKKFFRNLFKGILIIAIAFLIFKVGQWTSPKTIITQQEVIKEVEVKAPILEKIAKCESDGSHLGKNGQVIVRANISSTHNSVDIGKYQINSFYWGKKATEMGLNLWNEQDNETMAIWLYKNYGTEVWKASSKCWNR